MHVWDHAGRQAGQENTVGVLGSGLGVEAREGTGSSLAKLSRRKRHLWDLEGRI